jgi:hypothetical protein
LMSLFALDLETKAMMIWGEGKNDEKRLKI